MKAIREDAVVWSEMVVEKGLRRKVALKQKCE